MMKKRVNINDVAQRACVSKTTVSHVINNTRFVENETRQRVLQAIHDLGYRPSSVARSLTTHRTQTVGVIVSDTSNYFFSEVMRGIEDVLRPEKYALLVCNTAEILEREAHYLDILMRQRVDGIIAAATSQRWDILTEFELKHIPIVFLDRQFERMEGPFVGIDNKKGAWMGATYLIDCGHRRIGALAGFQRLSTMRDRLEGFRQALQERNIPLPGEFVIASPLSIKGGHEAMRQLLSLPDRPSAVFMANNLLSLGGLLAIKELGLNCPRDIALIGFDDHPWAAVSNPPLTVIRQPGQQLGETAARTLLAMINGETVPEWQTVMECELIARQSC